MLDFSPMLRWQKIFLVMLLAMSLPIRSLAAASMNCEVSRFMGEVTAAAPTKLEIPDAEMAHGADHAMVDGKHRGHGGFADHHHLSGQCSSCASCCFGAAVPATPRITGPGEITSSLALRPPSVGAVRFLTSGIERPPRLSLV